jgi:tetratricopeptide (TPR) repeat protein
LKNLEFALSGNYEESGPIPNRDEARIQKAMQSKVTAENLAGYIQSVTKAVQHKVGTIATNDAKEIYQFSKANGGGAQAANGLWIFGANLPAVLVLGNALLENPNDANNLNNYAAFLIMTGAEEVALPILNYLDTKYPQNSTILNNIGQGWFGLGDLDKATEYFEKALALSPGHSQANFTKSYIQENKGDKSGALNSMKRSIKTGYSSAKESRMTGFNYQLKGNDIDWNPPFPQDPLGFGQMNWPAYPKTVDDSEKLEQQWDDYRENLRLKSAATEAKFEKAENEYIAATEDPAKMMKNLTQMNLRLQKSGMPFTSKAKAKLEYYNENDDNAALARYESQLQNLDSVQLVLKLLEDKFEIELEEQHKNMSKLIGEGATETQMIEYCEARNKINNNFLEQANKLLETENLKWIEYWRKTMSRRLNYLQYSLPQEAFEMEKLRAQLMWLAIIGGQEVRFSNKCSVGQKTPVSKPVSKKLADFYDMNCKQKSVMNLGIGSVTIECNKMTTEVEAWFVKYSSRENMDNGAIIRGTVEVGFDVPGSKSVELGPVKAELKTGGNLFIEFDNEGVTDVGVKVGASAEVGTNVVPSGMPKETGISDQSITVLGAEAKWGWNSGGSLTGKGLLSGISIQ